jgi:DNA-binding NtrC family response regulator
LGSTGKAAECFRDALSAAKRASDAAESAFCYEALGNLARLCGRYRDAVSYHLESKVLQEQRGSHEHVGNQYLHLGLARFYLGDWRAAEADLREADKLFRQLSYDRGRIQVLLALCRLSRRFAARADAVRHARTALALAESSGHARGVVLAREELGDSAFEAGNHGEALVEYEKGLERAQSIAREGDLVYELLWRVGRCCLHSGDLSRAESCAQRAIDLAAKSDDRREKGNGLGVLAFVRLKQQRIEESIELVESAIDEFDSIEAPYEKAQVCEVAAEIHDASGKLSSDALHYLLAARELYRRMDARRPFSRLDKIISGKLRIGVRGSAAKEEVQAGHTFVTVSDEVRRTLRIAHDISPLDSPVLIEGETGTGKEVVAQIIHDAGPRRTKPFVALNCAAIPEALLESELFGHVQGAFTGADRARKGVLICAEDGTAFLDEIDKASLGFQSKLLRVIEDKRVRSVGSSNWVPLRARIICAANRDLIVQIEKDAFLPDLYYRLSGFRLQIPPLRERPEDIPVLVRHFLGQCAGASDDEAGVGYEVLPEVASALAGYQWPGNVRELKNVVESSAFFAREDRVLRLEHMPAEIREGAPPGEPRADTLPARIAVFERKHIIAAMKAAHGVKTEAARILGVSRKGLNDRLNRLGLE